MIYCPQCGTPNMDDSNFCNNCGEPLVNAELYDQIRNKAEMEAYLERQQREREQQAYSKAYRKAQKEAKREAARLAKEGGGDGAVGAPADGVPSDQAEAVAAQTAPSSQPGVTQATPNSQPTSSAQATPTPQGTASQGAPSSQPIGTPQGAPNSQPNTTGTQPNPAATQSNPYVQPEPDFPIYKHGCLAQAWDDITESPGWGKEICLLGLVNMVPVLNFFVTGYSMKWAGQLTRDQVGPMPNRIFADGSFLHGFYAFVISLVVGLVGSAIASIFGFVPNIGVFVPVCATLILQMYWALSVMRVEMASNLGPGFDVGVIFKAIFSNRFGKVFSVTIVPKLIVGAAILFLCCSMLVVFGLGTLNTIANVYELTSYGWYSWDYLLQAILAIVPLVFFMYLITAFLGAIATVLTLRATAHYIVRYERTWTMLG